MSHALWREGDRTEAGLNETAWVDLHLRGEKVPVVFFPRYSRHRRVALETTSRRRDVWAGGIKMKIRRRVALIRREIKRLAAIAAERCIGRGYPRG